MELDLGLGLRSKIAVDLNCGGYDLALQLRSPNCFSAESTAPQDNGCTSTTKKRSFEKFVEENQVVPETLPLLFWVSPPNDGEDNHKPSEEDTSSLLLNRNDADGMVGWPPVRAWRTKKLRRCGGGWGGRTTTNSKFVKVKMEGVPIARKIDLALHHSLETLMITLNHMFGYGSENPSGYELAFQDCNGEWLLAEGMPWGTFVGSVQRLKLMRVGACSTNQ